MWEVVHVVGMEVDLHQSWKRLRSILLLPLCVICWTIKVAWLGPERKTRLIYETVLAHSLSGVGGGAIIRSKRPFLQAKLKSHGFVLT